jgi:hypothetical protein
MTVNCTFTGNFVRAAPFYPTTTGDQCSLMPVCYGSRLVSRDIDGLIGKTSEDGTISTFRNSHLDIRTKGQVTFQDFIVVAHYGLL